jgi:hypothetical protein
MATGANKPGRFVPTLTQVVQTAPTSALELPTLTKEMQEELVMRVMQRLDVALEKKLPSALSRLVLAHMQELGPRLWEEVSTVVQQSVVQAVAQELEARNTQSKSRP